jgi:hypothetical protein
MATTGLHLQAIKLMRLSTFFLLLSLLFTAPLQAAEFTHEGAITDINTAAGEVKINDQLYLLTADAVILNSNAEPEPGLELTVGQKVAFETDEFGRIITIIVRQGAPL